MTRYAVAVLLVAAAGCRQEPQLDLVPVVATAGYAALLEPSPPVPPPPAPTPANCRNCRGTGYVGDGPNGTKIPCPVCKPSGVISHGR